MIPWGLKALLASVPLMAGAAALMAIGVLACSLKSRQSFKPRAQGWLGLMVAPSVGLKLGGRRVPQDSVTAMESQFLLAGQVLPFVGHKTPSVDRSESLPLTSRIHNFFGSVAIA
jgi:hypothetical protein